MPFPHMLQFEVGCAHLYTLLFIWTMGNLCLSQKWTSVPGSVPLPFSAAHLRAGPSQAAGQLWLLCRQAPRPGCLQLFPSCAGSIPQSSRQTWDESKDGWWEASRCGKQVLYTHSDRKALQFSMFNRLLFRLNDLTEILNPGAGDGYAVDVMLLSVVFSFFFFLLLCYNYTRLWLKSWSRSCPPAITKGWIQQRCARKVIKLHCQSQPNENQQQVPSICGTAVFP